jgi:hypothetical protein
MKKENFLSKEYKKEHFEKKKKPKEYENYTKTLHDFIKPKKTKKTENYLKEEKLTLTLLNEHNLDQVSNVIRRINERLFFYEMDFNFVSNLYELENPTFILDEEWVIIYANTRFIKMNAIDRSINIIFKSVKYLYEEMSDVYSFLEFCDEFSIEKNFFGISFQLNFKRLVYKDKKVGVVCSVLNFQKNESLIN